MMMRVKRQGYGLIDPGKKFINRLSTIEAMEEEEITCPTCSGKAFKRDRLKTGDVVYDVYLCRICGKKITKAKGIVNQR